MGLQQLPLQLLLGVEALIELVLHGGVELHLEDAVVAMWIEIDHVVGVEETGEELEAVCVALIRERELAQRGVVHVGCDYRAEMQENQTMLIEIDDIRDRKGNSLIGKIGCLSGLA